MENIYTIFGLPVKIACKGNNPDLAKSLDDQFGSYPQTDQQPAVTIKLMPDRFPVALQTNPSTHCLIENGFSIRYPKYEVAYQQDSSGLTISLRLKDQGNRLIKYLKKFNNIQYNGLEERVGQIVWENCLYPATYFMPGYTLIHSSGFSVNNNEVLLLGGTGGVGKTSLELRLSKNSKFGFLNDDIAVINKAGKVFPNLSWPKIYAYNLQDNPAVKELLMKDRTADDKLAFNIKKRLWGVHKARRTIDPHTLFSSVPDNPLPLRKYILLSRGNYPKLALQRLAPDNVPDMNISIIKSEFVDFESHLSWHDYNATLAGGTPVLRLREVHTSWESIQKQIFEDVACYMLQIPEDIGHHRFVEETAKLLEALYL